LVVFLLTGRRKNGRLGTVEEQLPEAKPESLYRQTDGKVNSAIIYNGFFYKKNKLVE